MPIMFRQRQTDPNVDRYPWLEQAAQIGLANQGLQQNNRKLDQNQQQIDLAAQEAADASARWQQEFDMRKSVVDEQRAFEGDMANVRGSQLAAMDETKPLPAGISGPLEPADPEMSQRIASMQAIGESIKNPRARQLFYTDSANTLKQDAASKALSQAHDQLAQTIMGLGRSEFPAVTQTFQPRYDQLAEFLQTAENPDLMPEDRAAIIDQGMGIYKQLQAAQEQAETQAYEDAQSLGYMQAVMQQAPPGSPQAADYAQIMSGYNSGRYSAQTAKAMFANKSIGNVAVERDGKVYFTDPKTALEDDREMRKIKSAEAIAMARAQAQSDRSSGGGSRGGSEFNDAMRLMEQFTAVDMDPKEAWELAKREVGMSSMDGSLNGLPMKRMEEARSELRAAYESKNPTRISAAAKRYGITSVTPQDLGIEVKQDAPVEPTPEQPEAQRPPAPPSLIGRMMSQNMDPEQAADVLAQSIEGAVEEAARIVNLPERAYTKAVRDLTAGMVGGAKAVQYAKSVFEALASRGARKKKAEFQQKVDADPNMQGQLREGLKFYGRDGQ